MTEYSKVQMPLSSRTENQFLSLLILQNNGSLEVEQLNITVAAWPLRSRGTVKTLLMHLINYHNQHGPNQHQRRRRSTPFHGESLQRNPLGSIQIQPELGWLEWRDVIDDELANDVHYFFSYTLTKRLDWKYQLSPEEYIEAKRVLCPIEALNLPGKRMKSKDVAREESSAGKAVDEKTIGVSKVTSAMEKLGGEESQDYFGNLGVAREA